MHLILPKCTLFFRNAPDSRKNAPCFQKCTRLSKKCTPLFQKCTLKNQKCTRAFSLGAFFYQNRCTKPTERQGYVPTQIIEKREILTVRVSLSHFYPTLIRQLPSHFCFKTLLWVLAQGPPLRDSQDFCILFKFCNRLSSCLSTRFRQGKTGSRRAFFLPSITALWKPILRKGSRF